MLQWIEGGEGGSLSPVSELLVRLLKFWDLWIAEAAASPQLLGSPWPIVLVSLQMLVLPLHLLLLALGVGVEVDLQSFGGLRL